MSSFGGTEPARHAQLPGSSCLEPDLKLSSLEPVPSVNGVTVRGGVPVPSQSVGSPTGESAVFPSISKLPTLVPAIAAGASTANRATTDRTANDGRAKLRTPARANILVPLLGAQALPSSRARIRRASDNRVRDPKSHTTPHVSNKYHPAGGQRGLPECS